MEKYNRLLPKIKKALAFVVRYYLLPVVFLVLSFYLYRNQTTAGRDFSAYSLRYEASPLYSSTVAQAKSYLEDETAAPELAMTFSFEEEGITLSSEKGTATTNAIYIDGNAAAVYPASFLSGTYPSSLDKGGVAISENLAWKLFGGVRLAGMTLEYGEETFRISGVFEGKDDLILVQCDAAQMAKEEENGQGEFRTSFTQIMVTGASAGDAQQEIKNLLGSAGLPEPELFVEESNISALVWLLGWLPFSVVIVYFLALGIGVLRRIPFLQRQLILLALLFALAIAIPAALAGLPAWVIPNNWSDMTHWAEVAERLRVMYTQWLGAAATPKDVQLLWLIVGQASLAVPAMLAAFGSAVLWHGRFKEALALDDAERRTKQKVVKDTEEEDMMRELEMIRQKTKEKRSL